mgnify:CR=1 FL=1
MISNNNVSNVDNVFPFNPINKMITFSEIETILYNHGVHEKPKDINLYNKAFLHRSYCTRKNDNVLTGNTECPSNCLPLQEESNERLEFLGDAILNFVVGNYLYERYPDANEGFLTKIRTKIVNGTKLAELATYLRLGDHLIISHQLEQNKGRENKNNLEDVFEALLGAIYLDYSRCNEGFGFETVTAFIVSILETYIDFSTLVVQKVNPKDTFIKLAQHNFQWTPKFYEINVCDKDNIKEHTISIKNNQDFTIAVATGGSRKIAEINAAEKALKYYGWS